MRTGVAVDYVPWPANGCSLAEARERVADRALLREWRRLVPADGILEIASGPNRRISNLTQSLADGLVGKLKSQQQVAYGHAARQAQPIRIPATCWSDPSRIDWTLSTLAHARGLFSDVRIFPVLLAPCRAELVSGRSFADSFKNFILNDPEVFALSSEARKLSSEFEAVFTSCRCLPHGVAEWPLAFERWSIKSTVHPDPAKRSHYDVPRKSDLIEMVTAIEALHHRYKILITMLRDREIEGRGVLCPTGLTEAIPPSIWAHAEFHIDAVLGDIGQDNPMSTARWADKALVRSHARKGRVESDETAAAKISCPAPNVDASFRHEHSARISIYRR